MNEQKLIKTQLAHHVVCDLPKQKKKEEEIRLQKEEEQSLQKQAIVVDEVSYKKKPIPGWFRWAVFKRDGYRCCKCGSEEDLTIDHIYPESRGGELTPDNVETLCRSCNSSKNDRVV